MCLLKKMQSSLVLSVGVAGHLSVSLEVRHQTQDCSLATATSLGCQTLKSCGNFLQRGLLTEEFSYSLQIVSTQSHS